MPHYAHTLQKLNAFTSLGKEQGLNSPVSEAAAFAYCNALNFLLINLTGQCDIVEFHQDGSIIPVE